MKIIRSFDHVVKITPAAGPNPFAGHFPFPAPELSHSKESEQVFHIFMINDQLDPKIWPSKAQRSVKDFSSKHVAVTLSGRFSQSLGKCFSSSFHMSRTQEKHSCGYVSVWACALSAKETQTLLLLPFIFSDLHQWIYWRLEIGAYQSQRIKDCFEPLLLFLQHFFLSATFFLHLLHSAGHTSICFWMPRFLSSMVVWFVLRSIKLTCINNTNLNGSQSWSIASQNPRSSNKVSLSCVCILSSIEREREAQIICIIFKEWIDSKGPCGQRTLQAFAERLSCLFHQAAPSIHPSWHLIASIFLFIHKFQDFL